MVCPHRWEADVEFCVQSPEQHHRVTDHHLICQGRLSLRRYQINRDMRRPLLPSSVIKISYCR